MPNTFFFNILQGFIRFFQYLFQGFTSLLKPLYRLSPLPDSVDLLLVCLIIAAIIFAIFQSRPWDKK